MKITTTTITIPVIVNEVPVGASAESLVEQMVIAATDLLAAEPQFDEPITGSVISMTLTRTHEEQK